MIWLQSNNKFDTLAEYDPIVGSYILRSRKTLGNPASQSTEGSFAILSNVFVALYRLDQHLYIRIGDEAIPLADNIIVKTIGSEKHRTLLVENEGKELIRLDYALDLSDKFPDDPTPFIGDEDFDFGLFLSNISQSDNRKKVLLGLR